MNQSNYLLKRISSNKSARICMLFLFVSMSSLADKTPLFSEYSISLPFNLTQAVIAINLLENPGNELVAIGVTQSGERQLAIYALDPLKNKMEMLDLLSLSNALFAYDVGVIQKNELQSLYFLASKTIYRYEYIPNHSYIGPVMAASGAEPRPTSYKSASRLQPVIGITSMYMSAASDALQMVDFSLDLNDDQLDDFKIAHFATVNLWLSQQGSTDFIAQSLAIPALLKVDGKAITFKPHELFVVDINNDEKSDIVIVESGQLRIFQQNAQSQFSTPSQAISLATDIEGINWWDKIDADGQQLDQSNLKHKMVELITDINGDAVADLVVRYTQSSGVLDRTNDYEIYYGVVGPQGLQFAQSADTLISSDSTLSDFKLVDLDNDGQQEVMVSAFDLGVSQIISALLSSSIEQEIFIYKMDEKQLFPSKPTASQEVEITFSLSSGRSGEPMVKLLDINGDGLKDFVFSDEDEQIKVTYALNDPKRLFNRRSESYPIKVPKNAKLITHNDINLDNKIDLILHYSRVDSPELLNKIIVLIAN